MCEVCFYVKWNKVAKIIQGESQEPWISLFSMYKEWFWASLSVSVLKLPNSFSPFVQEPFCPNPLHPVLQWCTQWHRKELGKPLCLAFQAGEEQPCTRDIKNKMTLKVLLQVYQHLHIPKALLAGKPSLLCHQPTPWPWAMRQDQTSGTAGASLPVQGNACMTGIAQALWGHQQRCLCPDPNALTSFPRLHHSHGQQTAGEAAEWCSSPWEGSAQLRSLKRCLESLCVGSFYFYQSLPITSEGHWYPQLICTISNHLHCICLGSVWSISNPPQGLEPVKTKHPAPDTAFQISNQSCSILTTISKAAWATAHTWDSALQGSYPEFKSCRNYESASLRFGFLRFFPHLIQNEVFKVFHYLCVSGWYFFFISGVWSPVEFYRQAPSNTKEKYLTSKIIFQSGYWQSDHLLDLEL